MKHLGLYLLLAALPIALSCDKNNGQTTLPPDTDPNDEHQVEIPSAPDLGYDVFPVQGNVYTDTRITLTFGSTPTLGTSGTIRIYTSEGREVDSINMEDVAAKRVQMQNATHYSTTMDLLCANPGTSKYYRVVNYEPVTVSGTTVTIIPHSCVLDHDTEYYITIDAEAIDVQGFSGVKAGEWAFRTKAAPASTDKISVAKNGPADFRTIQAALNYACTGTQLSSTVITVGEGTYEEQLYLRGKSNITLRGSNRSRVILSYPNCETLASGVGSSVSSKPSRGSSIQRSGGRAVILFENCDNIRFENMTLENSFDGTRAQAEVIYFNDNTGEGRIAFVNCRLSSRQDTINTKGYSWFYNCTIDGNVDFIWGSPATSLFENCELNVVYDGGSSAYIVQCRCPDQNAKGFVFLNCEIDADDGFKDGSVYLARSSGNSGDYDNVTYANCKMDEAKISTRGWYSNPTPNPASPTTVSGWKEYGSTNLSGTPINTAGRYSGSKQLTEEEFSSSFSSRSVIFSGCPKGTDWLTE